MFLLYKKQDASLCETISFQAQYYPRVKYLW